MRGTTDVTMPTERAQSGAREAEADGIGSAEAEGTGGSEGA